MQPTPSYTNSSTNIRIHADEVYSGERITLNATVSAHAPIETIMTTIHNMIASIGYSHDEILDYMRTQVRIEDVDGEVYTRWKAGADANSELDEWIDNARREVDALAERRERKSFDMWGFNGDKYAR